MAISGQCHKTFFRDKSKEFFTNNTPFLISSTHYISQHFLLRFEIGFWANCFETFIPFTFFGQQCLCFLRIMSIAETPLDRPCQLSVRKNVLRVLKHHDPNEPRESLHYHAKAFLKSRQINVLYPNIDGKYELQVEVALNPNVLSREGWRIKLTKVLILLFMAQKRKFDFRLDSATFCF